MRATVVTAHLSQILVDAITAADTHQHIKFYTMISKSPRFKASMGYMLEKPFDVVLLGCQNSPTLVCTPGPHATARLENIPVCKVISIITGYSSFKKAN